MPGDLIPRLQAARRTLAADFARNPGADARATLVIWRLGQVGHGLPGAIGFVLRRLHGVVDAVWTRGVIGAEIPRSVAAGPGLLIPHACRGVILHPDTVIGSDVTLFHQVTIGVRDGGPPPRIGDSVYLGAGAKVLGTITLGTGARVGANAVVVRDVRAGATVVGVPATERPRSG
jgi:serine O-acetyltransferase